MRRVLVIGLDGYDPALANALIDLGQLPSLARIRQKSARFRLDHGSARKTGLAWEHVSSGLSPSDGERWSSVSFFPETYEVWQDGPQFAPFPSRMRASTVVFDFPYFDMSRAGNVHGVVAWGAHAPGTELQTNPEGLLDEFLEKYGVYPASNWMHGFAWPSSKRCQIMGDALAEGVALRSKMALWLLKERFPRWELALIGVSESHSALEGLWHGIDERHPLNSHSSSSAAAEGIHNVYRSIDRLVGNLTTEFEDAAILIFSMHGMGPNGSDVPSMVLLPELLHRYAFGRSFLVQPETWSLAVDGVPILCEEDNWHFAFADQRSMVRRTRDRVVRFLPQYLKEVLKSVLRAQNGGIF